MYSKFKTRLGGAILQSERSWWWPLYGVSCGMAYGLLVNSLNGTHSHSLRVLGAILALLVPILGVAVAVFLLIELPGILSGQQRDELHEEGRE